MFCIISRSEEVSVINYVSSESGIRNFFSVKVQVVNILGFGLRKVLSQLLSFVIKAKK